MASLPLAELACSTPLARAELVVEGMSCGACVRNVEAALRLLPGGGVRHAAVTLGAASVQYDPSILSEAALVEGALALRWRLRRHMRWCARVDTSRLTCGRHERASCATPAVEACGFDCRLANAAPLPLPSEDDLLLPPPRRVKARTLGTGVCARTPDAFARAPALRAQHEVQPLRGVGTRRAARR
jgi:copper chaperone CopZ